MDNGVFILLIIQLIIEIFLKLTLEIKFGNYFFNLKLNQLFLKSKTALHRYCKPFLTATQLSIQISKNNKPRVC